MPSTFFKTVADKDLSRNNKSQTIKNNIFNSQNEESINDYD